RRHGRRARAPGGGGGRGVGGGRAAAPQRRRLRRPALHEPRGVRLREAHLGDRRDHADRGPAGEPELRPGHRAAAVLLLPVVPGVQPRRHAGRRARRRARRGAGGHRVGGAGAARHRRALRAADRPGALARARAAARVGRGGAPARERVRRGGRAARHDRGAQRGELHARVVERADHRVAERRALGAAPRGQPRRDAHRVPAAARRRGARRARARCPRRGVRGGVRVGARDVGLGDAHVRPVLGGLDRGVRGARVAGGGARRPRRRRRRARRGGAVHRGAGAREPGRRVPPRAVGAGVRPRRPRAGPAWRGQPPAAGVPPGRAPGELPPGVGLRRAGRRVVLALAGGRAAAAVARGVGRPGARPHRAGRRVVRQVRDPLQRPGLAQRDVRAVRVPPLGRGRAPGAARGAPVGPVGAGGARRRPGGGRGHGRIRARCQPPIPDRPARRCAVLRRRRVAHRPERAAAARPALGVRLDRPRAAADGGGATQPGVRRRQPLPGPAGGRRARAVRPTRGRRGRPRVRHALRRAAGDVRQRREADRGRVLEARPRRGGRRVPPPRHQRLPREGRGPRLARPGELGVAVRAALRQRDDARHPVHRAGAV
ncbi:MAG: hypothetical protein AVDCRST_MAG11-521, partial [uncultured Gemmatimonadaceae bacterium]